MTARTGSDLKARLLLDCKNALGEGIQWNAVDERLYWTDIFGEVLWSCDANGGSAEKTPLPGKLCAFAFQPDQAMIAGFSDGLYRMDPKTCAREKLYDYQPDHPSSRMNDGNLDRQGRFLIGGINEDAMAATTPIWQWDGSTRKTVIEGVGCANAICFSPSGNLMYFADSADTAIYVYDYDTSTGALGDRRVFADIKDAGIPDGATVDADGGLWNARFKGGSVIRFDRSGRPDVTVHLPVPNVTCCCIGGVNLDRLYITTARLAMDPDDLARAPLAGGLFAVDIPYKGLPHGQFNPDERTH